jgi:type IV secretory pathway VirB10-like protein
MADDNNAGTTGTTPPSPTVPPAQPPRFGPQPAAGSFSGGTRGVVRATSISKNVKIALFVLGSAAIVGIIWGVATSGVHHGIASANAPKSQGAKPATTPNMAGFYTHGANATGATSSTVSGATGATNSGATVPGIAGANKAKELAALKKIAISGTEARAQAVESAKTTRLQTKISGQEAAYNSPTLVPGFKPEKKGDGQQNVQPDLPNPELASMTVPTGTPPNYGAYLPHLPGQGGNGYKAANMQGQKAHFLQNAANKHNHDYLHQIVKNPISPYELQAGETIPAILITGIDSDLPGQIVGQVSQNVYSNINGALVIPQGSRLVGLYNSSVSYGQTRVQVAWTRLIYPDGSSINLSGMVGTSPSGLSGFHDLVDNHFWTIFGSALLYSVLGAGAQLAQPQQSATFGQAPSVGQTIGQAVGTQIASTGQQVISQDLNIQPTLKIRPGYQFLVMVNRDMVFPGTYQGAK